MNWPGSRSCLLDIAVNVSTLVAVLAGIGLVVGGLSYTGVAGAFCRELLLYADGNVPLMLICGRGHQLRARHGDDRDGLLHLPVDPAGARAGAGGAQPDRQPPVHPLLGHAQSYITPPVALAAITAANVAGSHPIKTGFRAMRLGLTLFILPFIFVYNPALIMEGSVVDILGSIGLALIAIWAITSAFEAWIYGWGGSTAQPVVFGIGGVLVLVPELTTRLLGGAALWA